MERLAVLYAEDNPHDTELALRYMRRHAPHIDLQIAASARECLMRLEAETFDAVLVDYRLPDRDGLELLQEIRGRSFPVAVVMLTGSGDPETAAAALKSGAYDYLVKQSDYLERLVATVEQAVTLFRTAQSAREKVRVLYAEHNAADIELTLRHCRLRAPHLEFDIVTSAREVIARLGVARYDVALLDYKMPELDGVAIVAEIASRRFPLPAVLITGQGDEETAVAALKAGAYDYLVKRESYLYRLPSALDNALARYRLAEEKAILERRVDERTRELTHANQRLGALATVAARIQRRLNVAALFQTLSAELESLGWHAAIALTGSGSTLAIVHISLPAESLQRAQTLVAPRNLARLRLNLEPALLERFARQESVFIEQPFETFPAMALGSDSGVDFDALSQVIGMSPGTRAVAAPLVTEGELKGLLAVWGEDLHESDVPAVSAFAGQMAVAIENARLHEQLRARRLEEQAVLLHLSEELLSTLFPQDVMERTAAAAARVLHADFVGVFLPIENATALELRAAVGAGAGNLASVQLPASDDIAEGQALISRAPARAGRPSGGLAQAEILREYGLQSALAVPLTASDEVLGVLSAQSIQARDFDDDDERILTLIAGQAAVALERARLYVAEQRRAAQLAVISEVGKEIMAVLDPELLLQYVVALIHERFRYAYVGVLLADDAQRHLVRRTYAPQQRGRAEPLLIRIGREGITGWVAAHNHPLLVNDVTQDARFVFGMDTVDTRAELAVPIAARQRVLGVLDVQSTVLNAFGAEDVFILQALAQQVAVALENARLYAELRRRAEEVSALLTTAAAIATPLALDVRLEAIAHHARQLVGADVCSVYRLVDDRDEGPVLLPLVSLGPGDEPRHVPPVRAGEGVTGRVAQTRAGEIARVPWHAGVAWLASVPLVAGELILGVMALVREEHDRAFVEHDLDLLSSFGTQAALAIQNADLVETLQTRARSLQEAYDRLAEADQLKDQLVQNISHELRTPLTFLKGYVDLLASEQLGTLNDDQLDSLQIVAAKTDTIIRLVDDVITLQALTSGGLQRERLDLNDLARRVVSVMTPAAERASLRLRCELHGEQAPASVDANRLTQVIDSLVSNAIKFSPDGGTITVRVVPEVGWVRVEVQDAGVGIEPAKLARIFDRFFQADGSTTRRFGGVGLGLAIVKQIVDLHGGRVEVESTPGQGSLFRVTLPAAPEVEDRLA